MDSRRPATHSRITRWAPCTAPLVVLCTAPLALIGCGADHPGGGTRGLGGGAVVPSTSSGTGGGAPAGSPTGGAPVGSASGGAAVGMSAGRAPAAGTDAGGASGPGPAPRDAAADAEGSDAGAATTMDASVDAGACATRAGTAGKAGFLGDWQPGTYPPDFESGTGGNYLTISGLPNQGGMDRQYAVHVPVGYDKGVPLPALFCLHAFSMNALSFCETMAGWPAKADKETFILIMPNGYQNSWNIGDGCGASLLPALGYTQIDDVGFMRALLEEVGKHVNIDIGRVYAAGFSDGSALAWRLACEASDIFTAVVPVAAGSCLGMCNPTNKVSVLDIYGGADSFNPTQDLASSTAAIRAVGGCSMKSANT